MDSDDDVPQAVPLQDHPQGGDIQAEMDGISLSPGGTVPVTLITGYLGAGKTTLVNHIVCGEHGFRIAVILNEFGEELGIEKAMLQEQDSAAFALQEVIELANGCLCCSVKTDFVQALEAMMQHRSKFDYILIETTGLADPGPVATALWTDEELESGVCLDAIVTVVDARHITSQLASRPNTGCINEAQQQLAYADVVLLNKVDLVSDSDLDRIEKNINTLNASADIIRTRRCSVPLDRLLGKGCFNARPTEQLHTLPATSSHAADADHNHTHTHDAGITTVCLRLSQPVDLHRVQHWLDTLLWETDAKQEDIFRMKGVLSVAHNPRQQVLQAVHEVHDIMEGPLWLHEAERESRVVVIGRNLNEAALSSSFYGCRSDTS